ncbi:unnamed protein product [Psylliodes chrysocephalus]|uniref:Uncharacterized protein n=1 Tax=Psylliodes chrysocephalus TaxID=3402493 RepID=A0A9P0GIK3_9CUCU|nr:unnamed protein product [Psylliodes chrysocephala]
MSRNISVRRGERSLGRGLPDPELQSPEARNGASDIPARRTITRSQMSHTQTRAQHPEGVTLDIQRDTQGTTVEQLPRRRMKWSIDMKCVVISWQQKSKHKWLCTDKKCMTCLKVNTQNWIRNRDKSNKIRGATRSEPEVIEEIAEPITNNENLSQDNEVEQEPGPLFQNAEVYNNVTTEEDTVITQIREEIQQTIALLEETNPTKWPYIPNFITLVHIWYEILRRIDLVQLRLQDPRMNFREAFHDLESLATELADIRDKLCEEAIEKAKSLCEKWDIDAIIRVRRRRKMPGELTRDVGLSAESVILPVMKSVLDRLQQEICTRLSDLNFKFGFLKDFKNLLNKDNVDNDIEKKM